MYIRNASILLLTIVLSKQDLYALTSVDRYNSGFSHGKQQAFQKVGGYGIQYIPNLKVADYGYTDIEKWTDFLIDLETKMLFLIGKEDWVEKLAIYRRRRYNWTSKIDSFNKKNIGVASDIFEGDEKNDELIYTRSPLSEELAVDATRDTEKLTDAINNILSNPRNWIISDI